MAEAEYISFEALIGQLQEADQRAHEAAHREEKRKLAELRKQRGDGMSMSDLLATITREMEVESGYADPEAVEEKRKAGVAAALPGKVPPPPMLARRK